MDQIRISDCTLKSREKDLPLSFREKIELCKQIDRLEISKIELQPIIRAKADSLLIKSVCSAVQNAAIAVPVSLSAESVEQTWTALKEAREPWLQVHAPVSSVQMEYLMHQKPQALLSHVQETIRQCRQYTDRVEFIAEDATRADRAFLKTVLQSVIESGARTVTVCDSASSMLPEEISDFIEDLRSNIPDMCKVTLGFAGSDALHLADACAIAAIRAGAREIKAAAFRTDQVSLLHLSRILNAKGSEFRVSCAMNHQQAGRITAQIQSLCMAVGSRQSEQNSHSDVEAMLSSHDTKDTMKKAAEKLGYELSETDLDKVWNAFKQIAEKKEQLTLHELDALIATEAMQVPPAYTDLHYVITTGNAVGAMAHMKLRYHEKELEGISAGDGVVDAAFLAIEKAIGRHFELDDFQIQAIAEGREAMGETLVKLRSEGKLYSGRGISTDIVGSSVMAYLSALNKIVFEEEEQ